MHIIVPLPHLAIEIPALSLFGQTVDEDQWLGAAVSVRRTHLQEVVKLSPNHAKFGCERDINERVGNFDIHRENSRRKVDIL
jgi:hypothetical protein